MIKRLNEIEISKDKPFEGDKLGYCKDFGEFIANIITSSSGPLSIAIDGKWGVGKTTFLRMLKEYLNSREVPTVLLNAWKDDFTDDPLAALIAELDAQKKELLTQLPGKKLDQAIGSIKKWGSKLLVTTGTMGIKLATAGVLSIDDLPVAEEIAKGISEGVHKIVEKQIEEFQKKHKSVNAFKEELAKLVKIFNPESSAGNDASIKKPLVIFVDELDRCRPTYAILTLERIKHLFDVPGIIFVFGVHQSQLAASIQAVYGPTFDAEFYLKRFFDVPLQLPKMPRDEYLKYLLNQFLDISSDNPNHANSTNLVYDSCINFANIFELDLRTCERVCRSLAVIFKTSPSNKPNPILQPFFAFLSEGWADKFEKFRSGDLTGEALSAALMNHPKVKTYWSGISGHGPYIDLALMMHDQRQSGFSEDIEPTIEAKITDTTLDINSKARYEKMLNLYKQYRGTRLSLYGDLVSEAMQTQSQLKYFSK